MMKKFSFIIVAMLLAVSVAWGEDYPNPTMEQVAFAPENWEGITVFFDGGIFYTSIAKDEKFGDIRYSTTVLSKDSSVYTGGFSLSRITFYMTSGLATNIVNAGLPSHNDANLLCIIEKEVIEEYGKEVTYWLVKIIKIELLDKDDNITKTLIDDGATPTNPIEEAVKAERAKWDANGDNKIGLEEAIRALQTVIGIK